nr:hypothetical protein [Tanacetum cinerariifolium]
MGSFAAETIGVLSESIENKGKVLLVKSQENGKVLNEEELDFLADPGITEDCDEISTAKAVLMANLSSYRLDVLSEDTNSSVQQDAMILYVFEQLSEQVTNCNKVNKDILMANESLSAEMERYKEQDTNSSVQQDAMILSVFEQLSEQVTNCNKVNKDILMANESLSAEMERYKEQIRPMLYDSNVIAKETNVISIADSEETLMLEEESRSKMLLKQNLGKHFVPQRELSDEQALHHIIDQFASSLVKIEAPRELPKSVEIFDSNAQLQEKVLVITTLKNDIRKLKGKDIVDNAAQISNATTMALGMYKIDLIILAPQVKNNRETHEYYLKHTMEQAVILREVVEQAKS